MATKKNRSGKNRKSRVRKNRTSRKSGGTATASTVPSGPGAEPEHNLPDHHSMEAVTSRVTKMAFPFARGGATASDVGRLSLLRRAQDIIYNAWEAKSRRERISLAEEAIALSDLCADAWMVLADDTSNIVEARDLCKRAVAAGENAVKLEFGPDAFTEEAGHFWRILQTRPYMRALAGLSECMWEMGEKEESVACLREMLRLNPNDNQGMRSSLVSSLFDLGDLEGVEGILETYREPFLGEWGWNMALLLFRREGNSARAVSALDDAFETNPFVPELLIRAKPIPASMPGHYAPGSLEEAAIYTLFNRKNWLDTKGALLWVAEKTKDG